MKNRSLLKTIWILATAVIAASCSFAGEDSSISIINTGNLEKVSSSISLYDLNISRGQESFASKGKKSILVLPITVKGFEKNATQTNKDNIEKTFFGTANETAWNSVSSFYYKSSYGRLDLEGVVADWYECGLNPDEIVALGNEDNAIGVRTILERAVSAYKTKTGDDCSQFDYDKDGYIDGVWMVYSAPSYIYQSSLSKKTFWAYSYYDQSASANLESPVGKAFSWASYDFMYQGYGVFKLDAHTYIHETAHMMGVEDYYDYNSWACPMGCIDMMDYNIIDHNVFTKFQLGWVTPYIVKDPGTYTLTIRPSQTTGDCVLIPTGDGWNGSVFDEYIMLEYYSPTGLNLKDSTTRYQGYPLGFSTYGVRIYHVDARLAKRTFESPDWSSTYTDEIITGTKQYTTFAHSNTPDSTEGETRNVMSPQYRLIQEMDCSGKRNFGEHNSNNIASNSSLFKTNDTFSLAEYKESFPNQTMMNDWSSFNWVIEFGKMSSSGIEITFTNTEVTHEE